MLKLDLAIGFYEEAGHDARGPLSRALTSLGRLHRAHGHLGEALEAYRRALEIQEAVGDRIGVIQSLNAIASVHTGRGQPREARRWLDRAFELAQQTSSPVVIDFVAGNLAHNLIETDDPARGVALLEGLLTRPANRFYVFYGQLADGYFALGQYARSVEAASMAILAGARGKQSRSPDTDARRSGGSPREARSIHGRAGGCAGSDSTRRAGPRRCNPNR